MEGEPPERDVKDFEFRQICKFRLFPSPGADVSPNRLQLLATSSKHGLLFTAFSDEVKMVCFARLSELDADLADRARSTLVLDAPAEVQIKVTAPVVHLGVSSDDLSLGVVTDSGTELMLLVYDLRSFVDQSKLPAPFVSCCLHSGGGIALADMAWNPAYPNLLAVCLSDGSVSLIDVKETLQVMASLPGDTGGTCLSWSPKGKQVMVGKLDGSCTQYDHELKEKKHWPPPSIFPSPHQLTDMVWVSTYTFLGSYLPDNPDAVPQPIVVLTVSNKEGNSAFVNFDDICFGNGEDRKAKYYFAYLPQWEMVVMSSTNATETTIVARHLDDKTNWEHWNLEDCGRAELPVTESGNDSFPLGMCVALCSQQVLQLGDNKTHSPCPTLLLLSTDGLLVPYHMAYFHAQAGQLTVPPKPLAAQGARPPVPGQPVALSAARSAPASAPSGGQGGPSGGQGGLSQPPPAAPQPAAPTGAPAFAAQAAPPPAAGGLFGRPADPPPAAGGVFGRPAAPASGVGGGFGQANTSTSPASFAPKSGASNTAASTTPFGFGKPGGDAASAPNSFAFVPKAQPATTTASPKPGLFGTGFSLGGSQSQPQSQPLAGGGTAPAFQAQPSSGAGAATSEIPKFSFAPKPGAIPSDTTREGTPASGPGFTASTPASATAGNAGDGAAKPFGIFAPPVSKPSGPTANEAQASAQPGLQEKQPAAREVPLGFALGGGGSSGSGQFAFSFKPTSGSGSGSPAPASAMPQPASTMPVPRMASPSTGFSVPTPSQPAGASLSAAGGVSGTGQPANQAPKAAASQQPPPASFPAPAATSRSAAPATGVPVGGEASASRPQAAESSKQDTADFDHILDSTISKNIAEEIKEFEEELQNLKAGMMREGPVVGTKEEMQTLSQGTLKMEDFCKEITATTKDQSREVQDLKGSCLDLFAMAEECRVRMERNTDPHYLRVLQQRTLDPATAQRMRHLRQCSQAIDQGLNDVDIVLDSEWDHYMEREKKTRIHIPSSDVLYRTIKSNHNVLMTQQSALEKVQEQLKRLQLRNRDSPWGNYSSSTPPPRESFDNIERPRDWRLKKREMLTPEKMSLLRDSLANHTVRRVRCQPLTSMSMSKLVRSERRDSLGVANNTTIQAGHATVRDLSTSALSTEGRPSPPPVFTSTPAGPPPPEDDRSSNQPTSFSGVAYFPKPREAQPGAAPPAASMSKPVAVNMATAGAVPSVGLNAASKLPTAGLGFGSPGAAFRPQNFHQAAPTSIPAPSISPAPNLQIPTVVQQQGLPGVTYENLTDDDRRTDDFEDDDDDGYEEDEEEDEDEDEEETGFGDQYEYPTDENGVPEEDQPESTPVTSLLTQKDKPFGSGINKNLFNVPAADAADPKTTGAPAPSLFSASAGSPGFTFGAASSSASSAFSGQTLLGKSLFGGATANKENDKSLPTFGGGSAGSAFGAAQQSATSGKGLFGTSTPPPSAATTAAAAPSATVTTASSTSGAKVGGLSGFGATAPAGTASGGLFGAGVKFGATSGAGAAPSASAQPGGLFSARIPTPTSTQATPCAQTGPTPSTTVQSSPAQSASAATATPTPTPTSSVGAGIGASVPVPSTTPPASSSEASPSATVTAPPPTTTAHTATAATTVGGLGFTSSAPTAAADTTKATTTTGPGSVFGSGTSLFSSAVPSFGSIAKTEGSTSAFSSAAPSATASTTVGAGLFGKPATATAQAAGGGGVSELAKELGEGLGEKPAASTSAFGGASASGSLFGSGFKTSGTSLFGAAATSTAANTTGSLFGGAATTTTSAQSLFSTPVSSTPASGGGGLFGTSSAPSGFGSTASPGSIFASSTPSSGGSVFGGSSTATTTTGSTFGFGQSGTSGGFGGFGKPAFGTSASFSQSSPGFGQTSGTGFGQPSSAGFGPSSPAFGQQATATSDTTPSSSSGGSFSFGGGLFGLGAKPSEEKAKQNVFGGNQTFGTASAGSTSSLFGSKGVTGFSSSGQTSGSGGFGAGTFSSSTSSGGVASMGFAVSQPSQSSAGGFGSTSAFGGSPSFGGAPAFGSTPAFGGSPAFGSAASQSPGSGGLFGSGASFSSPFGGATQSSATSGFGSFPSSGAPTFGNLAQSDLPSFGSLGQGGGGGGFGSLGAQGGSSFGGQSPGFGGAQQQPSGFGSPPSFGSSPSFSAYRG